MRIHHRIRRTSLIGILPSILCEFEYFVLLFYYLLLSFYKPVFSNMVVICEYCVCANNTHVCALIVFIIWLPTHTLARHNTCTKNTKLWPLLDILVVCSFSMDNCVKKSTAPCHSSIRSVRWILGRTTERGEDFIRLCHMYDMHYALDLSSGGGSGDIVNRNGVSSFFVDCLMHEKQKLPTWQEIEISNIVQICSTHQSDHLIRSPYKF